MELSCHCRAKEAGWVDVNLVHATASRAFSCDLSFARFFDSEAIDIWVDLKVMDFKAELSVIKPSVPLSLKDGNEVHPEKPELSRAV